MDAGAATKSGVEDAAELLGALAHHLRLLIVIELGNGPRCVHELVEALDASQPLVSQHLRVLRAARLVIGQRRGREIAYSLADDHVAHIVGDAIRHSQETQRDIEGKLTMPETQHLTHEEHPHAHAPDCGHASAEHGDHVDYFHDGHVHVEHGDHWDECLDPAHAEHVAHDHIHGEGCGHERVQHDDHVDYLHDGHRHAEHDGHWDEH